MPLLIVYWELFVSNFLFQLDLLFCSFIIRFYINTFYTFRYFIDFILFYIYVTLTLLVIVEGKAYIFDIK